MMPQIILGSSSINRRELLSRLQLPFSTRSPDVDESPIEGETPVCTAKRLATLKADTIMKELFTNNEFSAVRPPPLILITSDQVAFRTGNGGRINGQEIFDKPITRERAIAQLISMQGRAVSFFTSLEVRRLNLATQQCEAIRTGGVMTTSVFRPLSPAQIERYVDADNPLQCAGAARCEALGIALLSQVESSDPTALIGLPLILLTDFFHDLGVTVL